MSERRRWLWPLAVAGCATVLAAWQYRSIATAPRDWRHAPAEVRALLWPEPRPLPEFRLTDEHGVAFGPERLRGEWGFVFFGYLDCPDVCPLTLHALRDFRRALRQRDPAAGGYRFVFVSVDPARDDQTRMAAYIDWFDPDFVGLTGAAEALAPLRQALAIKAVAFENGSGLTRIDHTSSVMLVDPQGRVIGALPPPHEPGAMLRGFESVRDYLGR